VSAPVGHDQAQFFDGERSASMMSASATTDQPAIRTEGLVKKFGSFAALDGLDLEVARGEVHGFLGPNGAGKSTTIRVLLGLLRANAGAVELLGGDPWRDVVDLHQRLAYVPGDVVLWPGMSGGEAIDLLGNLRGGLDTSRRAELIERFELDPTKRGRQYSKGNRQKVAIVAALAADVELLILDEPTSGLDPLMEAIFQDEILKEKAAGRTILLSSHIMSQVEALADRVSIIRQGRIVQTGSLDDLRGQSRITITATLSRPPAEVSSFAMLHDARLDAHGRLSGTVDHNQVNAAMAALLPHEMSALTVSPASLEHLFLQQYTADSATHTSTGSRSGAEHQVDEPPA
jgi:ABC-2 type transport system ATP-binding protein